jgi:hypothetical protein
MESAWRVVQEGGLFAYPILLLGVLGFFGSALGVVLGVVSRRGALVMGPLLAALAAVLLALAGTGQRLGQLRLDEAIANVNPQDIAVIRLAGTAELRSLWILGLALAALPFGTALFLAGKLASDRVGGRTQLLAAGLLAGLGAAGAGGTAAMYENALRNREEALASMDAADRDTFARGVDEDARRLLWGPGVGSAAAVSLGVILFIAGLGSSGEVGKLDGAE